MCRGNAVIMQFCWVGLRDAWDSAFLTSSPVIVILLVLTPWVAKVSGRLFWLQVTEIQCELVKQEEEFITRILECPTKPSIGLKMCLRKIWSQRRPLWSLASAFSLHTINCFILPPSLPSFLSPPSWLGPRQLYPQSCGSHVFCFLDWLPRFGGAYLPVTS